MRTPRSSRPISRLRLNRQDPLFFAIIDNASGKAVGYQTFMRIEPAHRVIEVGNILYTPAMQRTIGATEAQYLFAPHVFDDLGYRRYEWKCNELNAPSTRAAPRFGFTFEGIFRQHMIVKGRNRDTAWFSMLDRNGRRARGPTSAGSRRAISTRRAARKSAFPNSCRRRHAPLAHAAMETQVSWPKAVTLTGAYARLETLSRDHCAALTDAIKDGELWRLWYTSIPTPAGMKAEIERRLALFEQGSMLPFAVIDLATGQPVGMTTYMNIDAAQRRVEIGFPWYKKSVQRSAINTECKLLLLRHAFEALDCIAVEFRTHFFNQQSRRAIERLGQAGRSAAESYAYEGREFARYLRVFDHRWRMANGSRKSALAD